MRPGQGTLLCQCCLIALLKTAAIRHAPENSGNELWIVYITEAVKELILVTEVQVQPGVERIAVFADCRGSGEIGNERPVCGVG